MNTALVGYSGFVGTNLRKQFEFNDLYDVNNINDIKGKHYDLLVCACISADKQLANRKPEEDLERIDQLLATLKECTADKVVLISTIDTHSDDAYGKNRLYAENQFREIFDDVRVVRLPGLFGEGLKKNTIYDIMTIIPTFFKEDKFEKLKGYKLISDSYDYVDGIYRYNGKNKEVLKELLKSINETSLKFTNINSTFQFFNLNYLWHIIEGTDGDIEISSDPISIAELADYLKLDRNLFGTTCPEVHYDTIYGVIKFAKAGILSEIKEFVCN